MELRFSPKSMQYLCRVLHETKYQEETMETIVPDSCPDVERVLCGSAVVVMRSKECRAGSAAVSGGIRAGIMYVAEGEKLPRQLDVYMPFAVKADSPRLTEDCGVLFHAEAKTADVRMVNSRKLMVRVNLCWTLTAYGSCEQTLYTLEEPPAALQTCEVEYPMLLPAETAERSFQMTEELNLPGSRPLVGAMYQFRPRLEITERRLAGSKAVFKGIAHLQMLYGSEDDTVAVYETELPFSQYCELSDIYDEDDVQLCMALTGCELERVTRQEGDGVLLSLHILAQCVVYRRQDVKLVTDAYCLDGALQPKWQECAFTNRLDKQVLHHTVRESREGSAADVAAAWVCPDHVQTVRVDGGVEISAPCMVNVLYYDTNGDMQYMSFRSEGKETVNLAENAVCYAKAELSGDVTAIPTGGGVELRYPVAMTVESYADSGYRTLCGGEIKEAEGRRERPAVIARRTRSGELLWDIAKASGTTVEKIRRANRMEQDVTEAGVLLIPT